MNDCCCSFRILSFCGVGKGCILQLYSDLYHSILFSNPSLLHSLSLLVWKSQYGFCYSLSHTLTHSSSHAFPCSAPGLVSPYFLCWLQAVSFFRSCIYPLGTLTSFEQQIKNSISNSVPRKICFHCTGKTLFYSAVVWFHLTISISKKKPSPEYHTILEFYLISFQGLFLVS